MTSAIVEQKPMHIEFEPDYRGKVLTMSFREPTVLASPDDVRQWRQQWMAALTSWHSPYKALVDCRNLRLAPADGQVNAELAKSLTTMLSFFNGFFLRKIAGFGFDAASGHGELPFKVLATYEEAAAELGIRGTRERQASADLRANLQFDNHFRQHVVEMTCLGAVVFDSPEKIAILKDKLTNNLMQWHSAWSLLIDCSQVTFTSEVHAEFAKMERFFKGFFLKKVLGYSPQGPKESYPFEVFRARHRAPAYLEGEGNFSGEEAQCASRKGTT